MRVYMGDQWDSFFFLIWACVIIANYLKTYHLIADQSDNINVETSAHVLRWYLRSPNIHSEYISVYN